MSYVEKLTKELQRMQDKEGLLQIRITVRDGTLSEEVLAKNMLDMLNAPTVTNNEVF